MVHMNKNYFKHIQAFTMSSTWLHWVCGNVILTNIINTVDVTIVQCDVWQIECRTDDMAYGKAKLPYRTYPERG